LDRINFDQGKQSALFANWTAPKSYKLVDVDEEVNELKKFLKDGDVAIDIGANIGDSTLPIAIACGKTGSVLALEPNPATFTVLGACAAMNADRMNIIPMPFAATAEECDLVFDYGDPWLANGGDHRSISKWRHGSAFSIPVKGVNVEKLLKEKYSPLVKRLRYIKIDAEGSDWSVVKSIKGLIEECRPYLKAEVNKHTSPEDRASMYEYFKGLGYQLHLVEKQKLFGPLVNRTMMDNPRTFDVFANPSSQ
jgi:FkbM family methyltransferase